MSWVYLVLAIVCEVFGTTCMKLSEGFTRLAPSVGMFALYLVSLGLLTLALKGIPVGMAYAIWSGLGTGLIAVIAAIFFHEPFTLSKTICLAMIVLGVAGLNYFGAGH
jgi:small multidrug resistance pump